MTDMTPEHALQKLLATAEGNPFCPVGHLVEHGLGGADALRAALSRPSDTEASRTLDALIALAGGDEGLPDDMQADVEGLRGRLSRPAVPVGYAGVTVWIGDKQVTRIVDRVVLESSRVDELLYEFKSARNLLAAAPAEQHPDDLAVDRFAQAMKEKLAQARAKGRSGWDDPAQCSPEYLADLLAGHVRKGNDGNFVDVANFAMMLHQRGAAPSVMPDAIRRSAAEESLTTEQPEDGPVAGWRPVAAHRPRYGQRVFLRRSGVVQTAAPTFDGGDDGDFWDFFGIDSAEVDWESDEWMPIDDLGNCLDAVNAERDALRAENADLRERVKELEADAKRWHFVRQFMCLDDVGDEDFCLGLITYGESLSERVDPAAQRLYKDRWDARCRAEYQGEELDQGEITVDEAIDAAMRESKS